MIKKGDRVAVYASDRKTGTVVEVFANQTAKVSLDQYDASPIYHVKQLHKLKVQTSVLYYAFRDITGLLYLTLDKHQAMLANAKNWKSKVLVLKKIKEI